MALFQTLALISVVYVTATTALERVRAKSWSIGGSASPAAEPAR